MSQQLQRLARTLGVQLVARTSHEVRLTSAGRAFEVAARAIVARMEKAAPSAREARDDARSAYSGPIRLVRPGERVSVPA